MAEEDARGRHRPVMERSISGFVTDEVGDLVALLACGHRQHLRHRPPFQVRPWILDPSARQGRLGTPIDCPLCDRGELPDGAVPLGTRGPWDEASLPGALRRRHELPAGRWALLRVHRGHLTLRFEGQSSARALEGGQLQAIPPGVPHRVDAPYSVECSLELFGVPQAHLGPDRRA